MACAVTRPRRRPTPALDQLAEDERGELLGELIAAHPELMAETERLARSKLAAVDVDEVAEAIEWALREADPDQLRLLRRAGPWAWVRACERSRSEILEELLQPELDDLARRAALGLQAAVSQLALGPTARPLQLSRRRGRRHGARVRRS